MAFTLIERTFMMRVVLPSNSSFLYHPNNTIGTYTTHLAEPLDLPPGKWEIGLTEIQYTRSWYNIKNDWIKLTTRDGDTIRGELSHGYYNSAQEIIDELNRVVMSMGHASSLRYSLNSKGLCQMEFLTGGVVNIFDHSKNVYHITGIGQHDKTCLEQADTSNDPSKNDVWMALEGCKPLNPSDGMYNIYVYCDIVENTLVGDSVAPLLRIVPIEGKQNQTVSHSFQRVQYVPIARRQTPSILIYLRADDGSIISFEHGRVVVTVDIRRSNPLL